MCFKPEAAIRYSFKAAVHQTSIVRITNEFLISVSQSFIHKNIQNTAFTFFLSNSFGIQKSPFLIVIPFSYGLLCFPWALCRDTKKYLSKGCKNGKEIQNNPTRKPTKINWVMDFGYLCGIFFWDSIADFTQNSH